jgi:hypothetical protein
MDAGTKLDKPHPRAKANFLSAVTFWCLIYFNPFREVTKMTFLKIRWTFSVFAKGYKKDLKVDDLFITLNDHKSARVGDLLEQ